MKINKVMKVFRTFCTYSNRDKNDIKKAFNEFKQRRCVYGMVLYYINSIKTVHKKISVTMK